MCPHTVYKALVITSVYVMTVIQNVLEGRGTESMPQRNTMSGRGRDRRLQYRIWFRIIRK
jgi:hypothetical protein